MQRIVLSFLLIISSFALAFGQSNQPRQTVGTPATDKQDVQGFFTPKDNCTSCTIKVVSLNGKPAIEVSLGCSKQPRNVKINGTVVPANHYSGSTYIAVLENAPRGNYRVSVKSQWVWGGAYYSECGGDVSVPNDVVGAASITNKLPAYCASTPITVSSSLRNGTKTNYQFREVQAGGLCPQIGNQIIKNGNPPSSFNLMDIFRAENGRNLGPGNYRVIITVRNAVSSKETTFNFTIRESSRDNPCDIIVDQRMSVRRLGGR